MNKGMRLSRLLLYIAGVLSLLYFAGLTVFLGTVYLFEWFWVVFGILLIGLGLFLPKCKEFSKPVKIGIKIAVVLAVTLFLSVEGMVLFDGWKEPPAGADYVIVLGARVNGTIPSLSLKYRIQTAGEYLQENPSTKVVASGGQGQGEEISEAEAIREGLVRIGISEKRIILENRSTNTSENLSFSKACIESLGDSTNTTSVVVVSSDFHIFRAKAIARKCEYGKVSGKGAKSVLWLQPHYYMREFFAVLKDAVKGNL